jgi:hypothetical protein
MRTKRYAVLLTLAACLPTVYFLVLQWQEQQIMQRYLMSHGLHDAPITRETALRVSRAVRGDFVVDETAFENIDLVDQPFLRESTATLLQHREGLCGEGARVIVSLLHELGFDATRVVLFNDRLESAHALVSVQLDGGDFLVGRNRGENDVEFSLLFSRCGGFATTAGCSNSDGSCGTDAPCFFQFLDEVGCFQDGELAEFFYDFI